MGNRNSETGYLIVLGSLEGGGECWVVQFLNRYNIVHYPLKKMGRVKNWAPSKATAINTIVCCKIACSLSTFLILKCNYH